MSQLNVTTDALPPGSQVYQHCIIDTPGTVAANNFLAVFNPAGNIKTVALLEVAITSYAIGSSSTPNSMSAYRITAASGGTQIAAANVSKFATNESNSTASVFVGNPTVTLLGAGIPLITVSPPFSTGAGNNNNGFATTPSGVEALVFPGEGLVIRTTAGNTNQMWGIMLAWAEF